MKALVVYLAALSGGAAVGAVGVGSWNVFLGDGVVIEDHAEGADSTGATSMVDASEGPGAGVSPVNVPPENPPESPSETAGETTRGEADLENEGLPVGEEVPASSEAGTRVASATQEDAASLPVPEQVPPPDADSLARVTQNYSRLARIFAAMKPAEAAPVLAQLEDAQLEGVLLAMQGRNAAPILAEMDPERAAAISRRVLGGNE
jgi:hypothetical protein